MMMGSQQAVVIPATEGKAYRQFGRFYTFKLWSEETNGLLSIVEISTPPQSGPPLHIHRREDQTFYIVEGEFEIQCGDQRFQVTRGTITFLPRNIPHTYRNSGNTPGTLLEINTPAGFEQFYEAVNRLSQDESSDMQKIAEIAKQFELELLLQ